MSLWNLLSDLLLHCSFALYLLPVHPASGTDEKFFWICQRMSPEKTFPQGFEYVLIGVLLTSGEIKIDAVEGQAGLGTHTDMRKYECSAEYVHPERDAQAWSSSPCYNEIFTTMHFVRNWADHQQMWKQLVWYWMEGAKNNARDMFGMPGMAIFYAAYAKKGSNGECIVFRAKAGQKYMISAYE
jgi:hypothetical protein